VDFRDDSPALRSSPERPTGIAGAAVGAGKEHDGGRADGGQPDPDLQEPSSAPAGVAGR